MELFVLITLIWSAPVLCWLFPTLLCSVSEWTLSDSFYIGPYQMDCCIKEIITPRKWSMKMTSWMKMTMITVISIIGLWMYLRLHFQRRYLLPTHHGFVCQDHWGDHQHDHQSWSGIQNKWSTWSSSGSWWSASSWWSARRRSREQMCDWIISVIIRMIRITMISIKLMISRGQAVKRTDVWLDGSE